MSRYWGATLAEMVEKSARFERMAKKYYAEHGKPYPGDPGAPFIEIARRGARGEETSVKLEDILTSFGAKS